MKMIQYRIKGLKMLLSVSICFALCLNARAQTAEAIQNSFYNYAKSTPHEKVFAHVDKTTYLSGELIWLKVYSVDAATHKPVNLSKVVYVDVLDRNNNAILQAKIPMAEGSGTGSIYLPVNIASGNYKLRAYTNWMKNFSAEYYYEKPVTIVNALVSSANTPANAKGDQPVFDVQFFPEGGNLVTGITSKVAFKITDNNGKGLTTYNGAIVNQQNDTVARFKPFKYGIGNFTFTPQSGNTYKAVVNIAGSKPVTKDIPAVNTSGYVMQLTDNGAAQLQVTVTVTGKDKSVYLFAHTRNLPKLMQSGELEDKKVTFIIDKAKLGEGVSQITVFNEAKQPVCERLFFKRPAKKVLVQAGTNLQQYGLRKKVDLNISSTDTIGKSLMADLSLSVYRVDSLQNIDNDDILSYLWLRSDLKGYIESAGYYLNANTAETREALDNLLLSQGWRKFDWTNVLQNKREAFTFLPEYDGHIVTASIVSPTNTPVADAVAYMGIVGKTAQMYIARSDGAGRLLFNTRNFFGTAEIILQTDRSKDSTSRIEIVSPFSTQYSAWHVYAFNLTNDQSRSLQEHSVATQILNIYSGNKIKTFYNAVTDSSSFYGKPDNVYLLDNYTRFPTLEEVLREYVPEASISKRGSNFYIQTLSKDRFLEKPPLVLLDGIPVFNTNKMVKVDPLRIYKLEVIRFPYYWGPAEHDGILSFTTYKGDLGGVEMDPNEMVIDYEGMQQQREFYSPVYDTEARVKSTIPDFRNLLFWDPYVLTGSQGKKQLSFYTSDQTGTYIGLIQGITANGDAASTYFKFNVTK